MKWWFDENNMNTYFILYNHTYWSFYLYQHTQNQHYYIKTNIYLDMWHAPNTYTCFKNFNLLQQHKHITQIKYPSLSRARMASALVSHEALSKYGEDRTRNYLDMTIEEHLLQNF